MSKDIISKIETKISELEGKVKQNSDAVGNIVMSIENLNTEKTRVQNESIFLSGSIQAFKVIISELQTSDTENNFQIESIEEV